MRFKIRIMFITVAMIAVFTCIGSMIMIHTTFQTSLDKEEQAALNSTRLVLKMLEMIEGREEWFEEEDLISSVETIFDQGAVDAVLLIHEDNIIYHKGAGTGNFKTTDMKAEENQIIISYSASKNSTPYIQTTVKIFLGEKSYDLHMGRNFAHVYEVRNSQLRVFWQMFLLLLVVGSFLAWLISSYLTKPIHKLQQSTKEIASGNLSYRSGISGEDEIAALSKDFDRMAEKLEQNIEELKESALQKERFMGAFTHELKTPMTSIIGYADLLRSQSLSEEEYQDALYYIFTEAKRLENMSLKMLDLFVADKKEPDFAECDPYELAVFTAGHLKNVFEKEGVEIQVEGSHGCCRLDTDFLQALLINLLDNAKKAMSLGGKILMTIETKEEECFIIVKDHGKGIPKEALSHLTEAFFRVDKARARKEGSAGIGLALCDKIVKLHHGTMEFSSEMGAGTTVTVRLKGGSYEEKRI